jgi:hypothetical protein
MLTVNDGATEVTSARMTPVVLVAAETTRIDLGGTGRPVEGTFQPPEELTGMIDWNRAFVEVGPDLADPPTPDGPVVPAAIVGDKAKEAVWRQQWERSPAGKAWTAWRTTLIGIQRLRDASLMFQSTVGRDGHFRIDDVPAGNYVLSVTFQNDRRVFLRGYRFKVPEMDEARSEQSLDLGILKLQK